jgi:hypothetical protein
VPFFGSGVLVLRLLCVTGSLQELNRKERKDRIETTRKQKNRDADTASAAATQSPNTNTINTCNRDKCNNDNHKGEKQ